MYQGLILTFRTLFFRLFFAAPFRGALAAFPGAFAALLGDLAAFFGPFLGFNFFVTTENYYVSFAENQQFDII